MIDKSYMVGLIKLLELQKTEELKIILEKFSESGWNLIAAIEQADKECGSCGCEFDPLYKKCIEFKEITNYEVFLS